MKKKWKIVIVVAAMCAAVPLMMGGCKGILDEEAHAELLGRIGETSFTVFPTYVRGGPETYYSAEEAGKIGAFITADGLGTVTMSEAEVPITGPWHSNQAKMLRESAEAFRAYIADNPIATEYALLPEYLIGGRGGVGGIHCYVLDKDGRIAEVALLNSHHKPFYEADPKTVEDCTDILIGVLRDWLVKPDGTQKQ